MRSLTILTLTYGAHAISTAGLFQNDKSAKNYLANRKPRANSHLFEEVGGHDFQQECIDEICNFEEFTEAWDDSYGSRGIIAEMSKRNSKINYAPEDDSEVNGNPAEVYKRLSKPCNCKNCNNENSEACHNYWNKAECICYSGYDGELCQNDIDECAVAAENNENLCYNHGECNNLQGDYECVCDEGWTGKNCEIDIDECLNPPNNIDACNNHGICNNLQGSFTCECNTGWKGATCLEDIDECAEDLHTCNNNQWCSNIPGSYECPCRGGFTGLRCEDDLDECSKPGVCPTGSVCTTDEFNSFRCACPAEGCFLGDLNF